MQDSGSFAPLAADPTPERAAQRIWTDPRVWHVLLWLTLFSNELLAGRPESYLRRSLQLSLSLAIFAGAAYFNLFVLVPRWLERRRYALYLAASLGLALLTGVLAGTRVPAAERDAGLWRVWMHLGSASIMLTASVLALHFVAKFVRRERELRGRSEGQLAQLRSQLHPHFLFNTLNNLYSLALAESPRLPELILEHSQLLRYSLYDSQATLVPLSRELDFMRSYVRLEGLRLDDDVDLRFEVQGATGGLSIAPLIFVPLVENCFTHLGKAGGGSRFVHVHVRLNGTRLTLELANSYDPASPEPRGKSRTDERPDASGIGLENCRQRLALLYGSASKPKLDTTQAGVYRVSLELDLCTTKI